MRSINSLFILLLLYSCKDNAKNSRVSETKIINGKEVKSGGKNKLTIVFDKALKGKKVQIEPFRGTPNLSNIPDYIRTTTIKEPATPKIAIRE